MKPYNVLLLLLVIVSLSNAQKIIEYDFLNFYCSPKPKINFKEEVIIQINNINLNLYDITDNSTQISYNTEIPSAFSGIKLPAFISSGEIISRTQIFAVSESKNSIDNPMIAAAMNFAKIDFPNNLNNQIGKLIEPLKLDSALYVIKSNNFNLTSIPDSLRDYLHNEDGAWRIAMTPTWATSDTISNETKAILTKKLLSSTEILKYFIGDTIQFINRVLNEPIAVTKIVEDWNALNERFNNLYRFDSELSLLINNCEDKFDSIQRKATELISLLISEQSDLPLTWKHTQDTLLSFVQSLLDTILAKDTIDATSSALKKAASEFKQGAKELILLQNLQLINRSNYTYRSKPIKVKSDYVKVDIAIKPKKPLPCNLITKRMYINDEFPVHHGCSITFSSGVSGLFGKQDFIGRSLKWEPTDTTLKKFYIVDQNGNKKLSLAIGGFIHIAPRCDSKVVPMLTFGVSTTTSFELANLHIGLSAAIGRKNRFIITYGTAIRQGTKLNNSIYKYDIEYRKESIPENVPISNYFPAWGHFISVSFNWTHPSKMK